MTKSTRSKGKTKEPPAQKAKEVVENDRNDSADEEEVTSNKLIARTTTSDKDESIFHTNFLALVNESKNNYSHLLELLTTLHEELKILKQDVLTAPEGFEEITKQLISGKFLTHPDKEVRLLVACNLAEILRIYAPDPPCKESDMLGVFELIINQIRGLDNDTVANGRNNAKNNVSLKRQEERRIYLLESLATVKSCVLPVIMAQSGVEGAQEIVQSLFETVLAVLKPNQTDTGKY